MKISKIKVRTAADFDMVVKQLAEEYGEIFFAEIGGSTFIYKPLTRKEYKMILNSNVLSDIEKEDKVCEKTVLWPYDINFDDMDAGIPTELYRQILTNSFLDSFTGAIDLIDTFREDLKVIDTQMSCIISEAFPNYDIEEIESWDMIKFCKIFSRAEWKLKNLRSMDNLLDVTEFLREYSESIDENEEELEEVEITKQTPVKPQPSKNKTIKIGNKEMTAEEYEQYLEFQRNYSEFIDFGADAMFTGFETMTADTVAPALRTNK